MPKKTTKRSTAPKRTSSDESEESNSGQSELRELFLDELSDIHDAERQLVKALPKMAEAADNDDLRGAFEAHLEETENQISRLEEVAQELGETLAKKRCKGMEGIIKEGEEMMHEKEDSAALDAALIAAAQKVEHYEIASYGTLVAWARLLGEEKISELLRETLDEEKATDEKLTGIAEFSANREAEEEA